MPLKPVSLPPLEVLRRRFCYDPDSGLLTWRQRPATSGGSKIFNARWAGKEAGMLHNSGYVVVKFDGKSYYAHRIIWKLMTGEEPPDFIDHKNRICADNKWKNLRSASHEQNMWNTKTFHNNTSGFRCVSFINAHKKYRAAVSVGGKKRHLGYFETAEEADLAVSSFIDKTRGEFKATQQTDPREHSAGA